MQTDIPQKIHNLLCGSGMSLATAESCTSGAIASALTSVSGSSEYFLGAVVAYSANVKYSLLSVAPSTVESHGIVSADVASEMVSGVAALLGADFAVATTGWADGPGDEFEPGGVCWIAVRTPLAVICRKCVSENDRLSNIDNFKRCALEILSRAIEDYVTTSK